MGYFLKEIQNDRTLERQKRQQDSVVNAVQFCDNNIKLYFKASEHEL